ncbi:SGNH/GDSL hydrolase family protein [Staphylococcus equorum]|uniref:SGNH/GDSL hydrolase family protein n=1 Tax=Staphylococcus equorum TaxID=246432 RepID=UPI003D800AA7
MPIFLTSLEGHSYPLAVETKLQEKLSEDGELSFEIIENKYTYDVIASISTMWTVSNVGGQNDMNEYRIMILDKSSVGEKQKVSVRARKREIDDLSRTRVYETYTGSFTVKDYFNLVFKGTGYKYKLTHHVNAASFENLGEGDSNLELFKQGLKRFGLEYIYDEATKTFTLTPSIGREAKYRIDTRINANNVRIEEDASKRFTYIRGYGDYEDDGKYLEGGIQIEFTHPLAHKIGKIHAPPIFDGRIKKIETLKAKAEKVISDSVTISVSTDFLYLEKYKEAKPQIGDITIIKDDVNSLNDEVRIVEITTLRDPNNKIIKQDIVLGDFRLRERRIKLMNKATAFIANKQFSTTETPGKRDRIMESKVKATMNTVSGLVEKTSTKPSDKGKLITTKNGTSMIDFTPISSIRNVKSIYVIGDSVAKGSGAKENFGQMLAKKVNAKVTNGAVGAATMSMNRARSIYEQALKITDTDLIIVQGTDDDWLCNGGVPLGENQTDLKTYYGAFYQAVIAIKKNNPNGKILSMTPTRQCPVNGTRIRRRDTDKNKLGLVLEDYVNTHILACTELNIPVYDAYHTDLIDPYNPAYRAKNMPDGLHPNEFGHEVIMYELIKNYHYFYD